MKIIQKKILKLGFTLSEVLITLAIVGVVAALTIPMVVSKYNKLRVESNLKKIYGVLNNALIMSEVDNGAATTWDWSAAGYSANYSFAAEFFNKYFAPYLKLKGRKFKNISQYNTSGYRFYFPQGGGDETTGNIFELSNGFSLLFSQHTHVNGTFGIFYIVLPNTNKNHLVHGKDIFTFVIKYKNYKNDKSSIKIEPGNYTMSTCTSHSKSSLINKCYSNPDSSGIAPASYCTMMIYCNEWKIPDDYPIKF